MDKFCHFLRLTGYYRLFIPLFAYITKPLNKLLRKDTGFHWLPQCQAAFKNLKQAFFEEPILQNPFMEKPYILFTGASHYAYSGVLTQVVEIPEDLRPIAFTLSVFTEMH